MSESKLDPEGLLNTLCDMELPGEELQFINGGLDQLEVKLIGGGAVLNRVFRITSKVGRHSVVMKVAGLIPRAKEIEDVALPIERQELEYNCLSTFHQMLPGCVPQPYYFNKHLHIILMEDVGDMAILSSKLQNGDMDVETAARLGSITATLQHRTHRQLISADTWQLYKDTLCHHQTKEVIWGFRSHYLMDDGPIFHEEKEWAEEYAEWRKEIRRDEIFQKLSPAFFREDCVGHFDMHYHNVFVSKERLALFDLEAGGTCNHAWPLSTLVSFYTMGMVESQEKEPGRRQEIRAQAQQAMHTVNATFFAGFGEDVHVLGPRTIFYTEMAGMIGLWLFSFALMKYHDVFFTISSVGRGKLGELSMKLMRDPDKHTTLETIINTVYSTV